MPTALISIGSNLGDRLAIAESAVEALRATPGVRVARVSSWRETAPVGGPAGQGAFLNGALLLDTSLAPGDLLRELQRIEHDAGRRRQIRWEARPLDLDLLLYDEARSITPELTLPHPRMTFRRFVLEPAAEVAPEMRHPATGLTVQGLLDRLNRPPRYFAIGGPPGSGRNRVAARALALRPELQLIPRPVSFDAAVLNSSKMPNPSGDIASELGKIVHSLQQGADRTPVVSPFWLNEVIAAANWQGGAFDEAEIGRGLSALEAGALAPVAVIRLDAPAEILAARLGYSDDKMVQRLDFFRSYLEGIFRSFECGAVLAVPTSDNGDGALAELLAALDASS